MKESKIVQTIIDRIGDDNQYKDTSDYLFEVVLPSDKKYIDFAEEYVLLEDQCVDRLREDKLSYIEFFKENLTTFAELIKQDKIEEAFNEFVNIFEIIKNNYCIRLNNARIYQLKKPDVRN